MLLKFVRRPGYEPATFRLSGKIHTQKTTAPSTWFRGSFYGIYGIYHGDDRWRGRPPNMGMNKLRLFCRPFVDIQQSFC